nr:PDZ domain-containing protein [Leucobacter chinensis]
MNSNQEVGSRSRIRLSPLAIGVLAALVIIIVGTLIPSPYIIEKPGPVVNTLGEITLDGKDQPIITIDGEAPEAEGQLNLLTVSIVGSPDNKVGWFELLPALFDHRQQILPMSDMFSEGESSKDREAANKAMMQSSQQAAVVSALHALGEEVEATVTVEDIVQDSAADGLVKTGDVITTIDGEPVTGTASVKQRVIEAPKGAEIELGVIRDGKPLNIAITPDWNEAAGAGLIGVIMGVAYDIDRDISFDVDRIGGPSAGMIFSLAIIESLSDEPFLGDLTVSGTGTIDDGGNVGAIGGLPQKMWAAEDAGTELFLMPVGNCADVPAKLPDTMDVVPVATLGEATTAIRNHRNGQENQGLERCRAELAQVAPVG